MSEKISRRQAIKIMALAGAGLAVSGTLLDSCSPQKKGASSVANGKPEAPEGSKIVSRNWSSLGDTLGLLGMGCMRFPRAGRGIDQEQTNAIIDYAITHGVNYFDTAPVYSGSEIATGIALSRYPRNSYYIATKLSNMGNKPTLEAGIEMFETSLKNLQTDYVDYLLMHGLGDGRALKSRFLDNGLLDYLVEQKKQGRIRHIGFSFHGTNNGLKEILDSNAYPWEFVQIQMNYLDWKSMNGAKDTDAETLYNMCTERNIPVVIMEPIRGGALANVTDAMRGKLAEIDPTLSPAGVALTFASSYENVMVTLSGMSDMAQITENVATFTNFKPYSANELNQIIRLADIYNSNKHIPCTTCSYCMPCPSGVNIPGNFAVYNTTSDELNIPNPQGEHDKAYKKSKKVLLTRYNKELGKGTTADFCTQCNACVSKCPQHINIPQQLGMISDLVKSL